MPLTTSTNKDRLNGSAEGARSPATDLPAGRGRPGPSGETDANRRRARSAAKQQQAAERIAAATVQISSQNAEAGEASRQLTDAMQQISSGAEESSGASQESLAVVTKVEDQIVTQQQATKHVAALSRVLQDLLVQTSTSIDGLLRNVASASDKQNVSVTVISELEKQADEIGEIVKTVAHIADQTNLLALNAAIEAARAAPARQGLRRGRRRSTHAGRDQRAQRPADPRPDRRGAHRRHRNRLGCAAVR